MYQYLQETGGDIKGRTVGYYSASHLDWRVSAAASVSSCHDRVAFDAVFQNLDPIGRSALLEKRGGLLRVNQ
jgi:hypothetical protein